ncbi:MAG: YiiX/YebB-like N1pC/P60 family cysteine hydrolase [Elusimicrobia bacterium]|nr:YiiX/YebB-like N1pC/P60 family cysteine hydrolase [Elusimicrobiota bacterium]
MGTTMMMVAVLGLTGGAYAAETGSGDLEGLRSKAELRCLTAKRGADLFVPAALPSAVKRAAVTERKAVLVRVLNRAKISNGVPGAGTESEQLKAYLCSPRAAAGLSGAANSAVKADRFSAIDAIWALGELHDRASVPVFEAMLASADHTVRLNLLAALKKLDPARRGTDKEFKDEVFSSIPPGDLLFREGNFGLLSPGLPVGHTAIFTGMENGMPMMIHATSTYGGVTKDSMDIFISGHPYYGNRTTAVPPTGEQRAGILSWLLKQLDKPYDTWHSTQKGPDKFDCVGLTEAAYESVGLNPTPDELEEGPGWPLEPYEQYDNTVAD